MSRKSNILSFVIIALVILEVLSFFSLAVYTYASGGQSTWSEAFLYRIHQYPYFTIKNKSPENRAGIAIPTYQFGYRGNAQAIGGLQTNQFGFIDNGNGILNVAVFPRKAENTIRIIMLGGSSLAGISASS